MKEINCQGRFKEVREMLFSEAVPLVLEERKDVLLEDLEQIWELIQGDIYLQNDFEDPYFIDAINPAARDNVRENPPLTPSSLAPLFPIEYSIETKIMAAYLESLGNTNSTLLNKLPSFVEKKEERNHSLLCGKNISIANTDLRGYYIEGGYGIGTGVNGGEKGGGIRSDSPFLINVYKKDHNLVAVIGFWAQGNSMLISQMQSCKNASFPSEVPFGIGTISVAEKIAEKLGFENVLVYTAKNHPLLKQYPENKIRLIGDLAKQWDTSAKKLGYNGGRADYVHEKRILVS
ncbi:hypothetical protein H6501_05120 [Candidatus Woesearchaeota archaeon]|nr:hypothetical protein [Candidatus Woesearchaeota archaeon]USN44056.1 MAG: hypothetical protein H6500_06735 [Candidatus Woesearchaeota archaeon]